MHLSGFYTNLKMYAVSYATGTGNTDSERELIDSTALFKTAKEAEDWYYDKNYKLGAFIDARVVEITGFDKLKIDYVEGQK